MRMLRFSSTALALAAVVTSMPTAAADPVLSTDSGAPAPGPAETSVAPGVPAPPAPGLADVAAGVLAPGVDLGPNGGAELLLGQSAAPAAPGAPPAITMAAPPQSITDDSTFLNALNFAYPGADMTNPYQLGQGDINAPSRLNAFRGARGLFHATMGKLDPDQLGKALPGTAPPSGTALPPGTGSTIAELAEPPAPPGVSPPA